MPSACIRPRRLSCSSASSLRVRATESSPPQAIAAIVANTASATSSSISVKPPDSVIPAKAEIHFDLDFECKEKELDDSLRSPLRGSPSDVLLTSRLSGLRRNDGFVYFAYLYTLSNIAEP